MLTDPPSITSVAAVLTVHCRMFGRYAEFLESDECVVTVPAGATAGDVVAKIRATRPGGERLPLAPSVAINRRHVKLGTSVEDGDEVALLPPLAGG